MQHLDDEQLRRALHDELALAEVLVVREHTAACELCRERLSQAEREEHAVHLLLATLDHPPPRVSAASVMTRARPWPGRLVQYAAATLCIAALGGVAWAAPGSPFPLMMRRVSAWFDGAPAASRAPVLQTPATVAPSAPVPAPGVSGIAVTPGDRLVIRFAQTQAVGEVRVRITEGSEVLVRALAGAASFTSDAGHLDIANTGSTSDFDIAVPRGALLVEVQVQGRRLFLKRGERIISVVGATGDGAYVFSLTRPQ